MNNALHQKQKLVSSSSLNLLPTLGASLIAGLTLFAGQNALAFAPAPLVPVVIPTVTPTPTATATPAPSPTVKPSPTPTPTVQPTSTPVSGSGAYLGKIEEIASTSSCASYAWKDRGRAPAGYIKGMALSFGRSLCRNLDSAALAAPAVVMSKANTGVTTKDAIAQYQDVFAADSMPVNKAGDDTLRALYTLGIGLGMRESSGNYCEGYDTSAGTETASEAEAGTFQASYNSMSATPELRQLYNEYQADPSRCFLSVFKDGAASCKQGIVTAGDDSKGGGAAYQTFAKSCPAFTAEYAMTGLRVLRSHWGPIVRKEAEVNTNCDTMLEDVQNLVLGDVAGACADLR